MSQVYSAVLEARRDERHLAQVLALQHDFAAGGRCVGDAPERDRSSLRAAHGRLRHPARIQTIRIRIAHAHRNRPIGPVAF